MLSTSPLKKALRWLRAHVVVFRDPLPAPYRDDDNGVPKKWGFRFWF